MTRLIGRAGVLAALVLGISASAAWAQDDTGSGVSQPRWALEGAAGFQLSYDGRVQSVAFGFAPSRSLTLLVTAEQSHIQDSFEQYVDGYSAERGGTEQFVSAEVRGAFFTRRRVSPYVLGGLGRGTSRPNVSESFPDRKVRDIHVIYYGAGIRIPVGPRFDVLVDTRLIMSVEAVSDYFGVRMPVRASLAWRF